MKQILKSAEKGGRDIEVFFIPTTSEDALKKYSDGKIICARKTTPVKAKKVTEEVKVDTSPKARIDGHLYILEETSNTAKPGSWIITNPNGEQYVIKDKLVKVKDENGNVVLDENGQPKTEILTADAQMDRLYYPADANGFRVPKAPATPKRFVKLTENVCFTAPWGGTMFAPAGSYLCLDKGGYYSITNHEFEATHEIEQEELPQQ